MFVAMDRLSLWQRIWSKFRTQPMKVFLVDDHAILLDGVKSLLSQMDGIEIAGTAGTGEEALDFIKNNDLDMVICDQSLPGIDGLTLIRQIKRLQKNLKLIILSMHDEVYLVKEILQEGVDGYVLKKDSQDELQEAIRTVINGNVYLSKDINQLLINNIQGPTQGKLLTRRELEILKLIAKEYSNAEIADKLYISERTVETHRKNIFRKTGCNSVVGVVNYAHDNKLI